MFINVTINKTISVEELREILAFAEFQETTDRYTDTSMCINGEEVAINVNIDADGNVELI